MKRNTTFCQEVFHEEVYHHLTLLHVSDPPSSLAAVFGCRIGFAKETQEERKLHSVDLRSSPTSPDSCSCSVTGPQKPSSQGRVIRFPPVMFLLAGASSNCRSDVGTTI